MPRIPTQVARTRGGVSSMRLSKLDAEPQSDRVDDGSDRDDDEVENADPVGVGVVDVDQVADRVQEVMQRGEREHRHPPPRPPDRCEVEQPQRQFEGRGVEDAVRAPKPPTVSKKNPGAKIIVSPSGVE